MELDLHDLLHLGSSAAVLIVLWYRVGWIKEWCDRHETRDDERFESITGRIDMIVNGKRQ